MRILVVTQYFWPETFRINDVVKKFREDGHDVDVLTGVPNYPEGFEYPEYNLNKNKFTKYYGANIYRVPIITRGKANIFRLFINYCSFVISATIIGLYKIRKKNYDIVFTFATSPITVAIPSIIICNLKNAKHVLWVLDLWPHILKELNVTKNQIAYYLMSKITKAIYERSHIILAQSKSFKKIISKYTIKNNLVHYFPQWAENLSQKKQKKNDLENIKKYKNKFNIIFTGNIGDAQNFSKVLDAAEILKNNKKIQWIIVGSGRGLDDIKKRLKKNKIPNFKLVGHKPLADVKFYHQIASVLLVSLLPKKYLSYTIPGKVQTYLSSNKFILGFVSGETAKLIQESKTGIVVNPSNPSLLANTIIRLKNNPKIINKINQGNYGKNYLNQNFNKNIILNNLMHYLNELLEEFKIIKNVKNIPFDRNFSLSGLNLAFIGYWAKGLITKNQNIYLWPDGIFYKRFFNSESIHKIPGRDIINKLKIPNNIKRIFVFGNLSNISFKYLENLYQKRIIHINLGYGRLEMLFHKHCNIKFLDTDLIILTLPTPKQEQFAELIMKKNIHFKILCVGGAINMASGIEKPVPKVIENSNLEFLWRLRTDTVRRVRRLFVSSFYYIKGEIFGTYKNIRKKIINN